MTLPFNFLDRFKLTAPSLALAMGLSWLIVACGSQDDQAVALPRSAGGTTGSVGGSGSLPNEQAIRVYGGPNAAVSPTANLLYTDVKVCVPGTSNCQTITDVQVDTGSSGLRILASELTIPLPLIMESSNSPLSECVVFADTTYVWGPLATADIQLGSQKAVSVPIQIVGAANFPAVPSACGATGSADDTVAAIGARGILGIGLFQQDCGAACAPGSNQVPSVYFQCPSPSSNSVCTAAQVPLKNQVQNPVWLLPEDNNGLVISLPGVPVGGAQSVSGSLIFGIETRSNNALGTSKIYTTDVFGNIFTTFGAVTYSGPTGGYIDSGSNLLSFPSPSATSLPSCSDSTHFYCPAATQAYTAVNRGLNGVSGQVSFSVSNTDSLIRSGNTAFSDLGGNLVSEFDWGLPFFFGRKVFVAIEGQQTPSGAGPYWAY